MRGTAQPSSWVMCFSAPAGDTGRRGRTWDLGRGPLRISKLNLDVTHLHMVCFKELIL